MNQEITMSKALFKDMDASQFKGIRLAAFIIIILAFLYNIPSSNKSEQVLGPSECLRDYLFIWSDDVNDYFGKNIKIKN